MSQTLYTCTAVAQLIANYQEKISNPAIITIQEGTLGYGTMLLYDPTGKYKTAVINEVAINCWNSGHKVRMYNKCPAKYKHYLEKEGYI